MAVYRVEKGEWSKVAADLIGLIEWADDQDLPAALKPHGFTCWDDVDGVYEVYRRHDEATDGPLAGVRYVFSVSTDGEMVEDILVGDWLPDFLHVSERLEVLVRRHEALSEAVSKSRAAGML